MFLFIDNYDSFSWNLVQAFYALGRKPVVRANDDPHILELATSPELEAVCISPGPSHPRNAGLCLEFLKRLPASVPVLGVCLGHQLLGYFAGAEVSRAPYVMHGKSSDIIHDGAGLFAGLPNPMTVGRYHSLVVQSKEDEPNPRFTVTSRGPEGEVMALRYNDRPWVGIQFHPESILTPNGLQLLGNFPDNVVPSGQKEKRISRILEALAAGQDLTADMAAAGFADIMDGRMTPAQAGCFLMGLRMKGETPLEMAHAVGIALGRANRAPATEEPQKNDTEGTKNETDAQMEIEALPAESPKLYLNTYEVTVEAGNDLDKTSYIKEMTDDADSQESLFNQIEIDGDVDTAVPGDYTLTYHVTDSDGNRSNAAVLTVHVQ